MPQEFSPRRLVVRLLALALIIGLAVVAIGSLPGLGTLRHRFAQIDVALFLVIGLMKLCSCLSNVVAFRNVFCRTMSWRFSYDLGMAEQGTNVLIPTGGAGGLALGAWALRQGGMPAEHIGRRSVAFFVLTSIPNFLCAAVVGPLLLLGVFPGQVPAVPTAVFTAMAWATMIFVALLPRLLGRISPDQASGRLGRRLRAAAQTLSNGIIDTRSFIVQRRWQAILGAAGYLAFDIAALAFGYAAFGTSLPVGPLVFAYVIGQLGGLIPLPGGIGGTDGGIIGALVLYGSPLPQAAAAELAYRAFQLGLPALLGVVSFVRLRHTLEGSDSPAAACAGLAEESLAT